MAVDDQELGVENGQPIGDPEPPSPGWRWHNGNGRWFAPARGRGGMVFREGNETVEEAQAKDELKRSKGPADRKPKPKVKQPKPPPAPTETDLRALEYELAQALSAPADIVAAMGDEWMADHFSRQGPVLARHIVVAAKFNPWLRAKLEAAMFSGDDMMIRLIMTMGLAGAMVSYAIPPLVYYLNPPFVSDKARQLYQIPERTPKPDHAGATVQEPESSPAAV